MIDTGLLVSLVLVVVVPTAFVPRRRSAAIANGVVDVAIGAAIFGLLVGRAGALVIDDPGSLRHLSDFVVIRSGVEFWPGLVAGVAWLWFGARRDGVRLIDRLAALTPAMVMAWAVYEGTCVIRDGCAGPVTAFGLTPSGLSHSQFPVGLAVAAGGLLLTSIVGWLAARRADSTTVALAGLIGVAGIKSIASFWLPHLGSALTRQHRESLVVFAVATIGLLATARARGTSDLAADVV